MLPDYHIVDVEPRIQMLNNMRGNLSASQQCFHLIPGINRRDLIGYRLPLTSYYIFSTLYYKYKIHQVLKNFMGNISE